LLLPGTYLNAQRRFKPLEATGLSAFNLTLRNYVQVDSKTLEFDVYIVDMDASNPFELAAVQVGININPAVCNGGTVSLSIVPGSSGLPPGMIPTSVIWDPSQHCIKLTPKSPPGAGKGFILPTVAPGARVCRLRMTNTNEFISTTDNETLSFTTIPYPTKVAQYIDRVNTPLICNSGNCFGIHAPITTGISDPQTNNVQVYTNETILYIKNPDNQALKDVFIYDLTGKEVFHSPLTQSNLQQFTPGVTRGDFIVKVYSAAGVTVRKVYLN
jgi:hypothetical protein